MKRLHEIKKQYKMDKTNTNMANGVGKGGEGLMGSVMKTDTSIH